MALELFELTDLAAHMKSDLDTASAEVARRIATSRVRAVLRTDPQPPEANTEVWLLVDHRRGTVRLPALLDTLGTVEDEDGTALTYTRRSGRLLTLDPYAWLDEVKVTYTYATVPGPVRDAALLIAAQAYGPIGTAPLGGVAQESETIDDYSHTVRYDTEQDIPAAALDMLRPYRASSARSVRLVRG